MLHKYFSVDITPVQPTESFGFALSQGVVFSYAPELSDVDLGMLMSVIQCAPFVNFAIDFFFQL